MEHQGMNVSITLGWRLMPLLLTIASFAWAIPMREDERPNGGMFSGLGYALGGLFRCGVAAIMSLIAWLIWSLLA
jgi:hypothetical protein